MMYQMSPTKGNLIAVKRSLELAKTGYELLDRKRNILIRETMGMIDVAKDLQSRINVLFAEAYKALQRANVTLGVCDELARAVPVEDGITVKVRSVMGVELPVVSLKESEPKNHFGFYATNSALDEAYFKFDEVKKLTVKLAEVENSVYRLAVAINKTQKRATALQNIVIPGYNETVRFISDSLEEKEREDFSHMKVIKQQKEAKKSPRKGMSKNENGENKEQ